MRLRYVSDTDPGIRRRRRGRGFSYHDAAGHTITDRAERQRIESLVIPPAWEAVWISPWPEGHLQATGRDARGRKQYRYHEQWRARQERLKFQGLVAFAESLPRLRRRIGRDLQRPPLDRERVLASVVYLLDNTLARVGNPEYARSNDSYGLTTVTTEHAHLEGSRLELHFQAKGGKFREVSVEDPRISRTVRRCHELPGQALFQYLDAAGEPHRVDSADVNEYLREASGEDFTAKSFRTWAATVIAAAGLAEQPPPTSEREARSRINAVVKEAAAALHNTPAVCRKHYIHPAILDAYRRGVLDLERYRDTDSRADRLRVMERKVLGFLREHEPPPQK